MTIALQKDARALRDLLADPDRWIQGAPARSSEEGGLPVGPLDPRATCWCLSGACVRVTRDGYEAGWLRPSGRCGSPDAAAGRSDALHTALHNVCPPSPVGYRVVDFNDAPGRTHEEIVRLLDRLVESV